MDSDAFIQEILENSMKDKMAEIMDAIKIEKGKNKQEFFIIKKDGKKEPVDGSVARLIVDYLKFTVENNLKLTNNYANLTPEDIKQSALLRSEVIHCKPFIEAFGNKLGVSYEKLLNDTLPFETLILYAEKDEIFQNDLKEREVLKTLIKFCWQKSLFSQGKDIISSVLDGSMPAWFVIRDDGSENTEIIFQENLKQKLLESKEQKIDYTFILIVDPNMILDEFQRGAVSVDELTQIYNKYYSSDMRNLYIDEDENEFFQERINSIKDDYIKGYEQGIVKSTDIIKLGKAPEIIRVGEIWDSFRDEDRKLALGNPEFRQLLKSAGKESVYIILDGISSKDLSRASRESLLKSVEITKEEVLFFLKSELVKEDRKVALLENIPRNYREELVPDSKELFDTYRDKDGKIQGKTMLSFAEKGYVDKKKLVNIYFLQEENKKHNPNNIEGFIGIQDFLEFFDTEKILKMLDDTEKFDENATYAEKFKEMYHLLTMQLEGKDQKEQNEKILLGCISKDDTANRFYRMVSEGILESNQVIELLGQTKIEPKIKNTIIDILLNIYMEKGQVDKKILPHLQSDQIETLCIEGVLSVSDIVEGIATGLIPKEILKNGLISNSDIRDVLAKEEREIDPKLIIDAYMNGILSSEDISEIGVENLEIENYKLPEDEKLRAQYVLKIQELVLSEIIDHERLEMLKENGVLSEDEYTSIKDKKSKQDEERRQQFIEEIEQRVLDGDIKYDELEELRKKGILTDKEFKKVYNTLITSDAIRKIIELDDYIINTGENERKTTKRKRNGKGIGEEKEPPIPERLVYDLITTLAKDPKTGKQNAQFKQILDGTLDGYVFISLDDMGVVLLEKLDKSRQQFDATYILPLGKALEIAKIATKDELRGKKEVVTATESYIIKNVERVKHTRNYGTILLEKIAKIQNATLSEDRIDIKWANDLIESIQERKKQERAKQRKGVKAEAKSEETQDSDPYYLYISELMEKIKNIVDHNDKKKEANKGKGHNNNGGENR